MAFSSLGSRGYNRLREFLVLDHAVRHRNAADNSLSSLVFSPGMTCEIAADNHFDFERLTLVAYGNLGIRNRNLPVRKNILGRVEELGSDEVQNLALERNSLRKDYVKS